jgi:hypothetical protein
VTIASPHACLVTEPNLLRPRKGSHSARRRYDPLGAVTVTGALAVLVCAISQAPAIGWTSIRTLALLAASAAMLAGFVVLETRMFGVGSGQQG